MKKRDIYNILDDLTVRVQAIADSLTSLNALLDNYIHDIPTEKYDTEVVEITTAPYDAISMILTGAAARLTDISWQLSGIDLQDPGEADIKDEERKEEHDK